MQALGIMELARFSLKNLISLLLWAIISLQVFGLANPCLAQESHIVAPQGAVSQGESKRDEIVTQIKEYFYQGIKHANAGQYSDAEQAFFSLISLTSAAGYSGSPSFSLEMLARAEALFGEEKKEGGELLVRHAVSLSPTDSKVRLWAFCLELKESFFFRAQDLIVAFENISSSPLLIIALLSNICFFALIALTLALFLLCFFQIIVNSSALEKFCAQMFPWNLRLFLGPLMFVAIVIVPLIFGLLPALFCWGLLLSRRYLDFKYYALSASLLAFAWGAAIHTLSVIGLNTRDEGNLVFESINSLSFSPKAELHINQRLKAEPENPALLFFLALTKQIQGEFREADQLYIKTVNLASSDSYLSKISLLNRGVIAQREERYNDAKSLFDSLLADGFSSFELYYNSALNSLALLDTAAHAAFYRQALEYNPKLMKKLELRHNDQLLPIIAGLPFAGTIPLAVQSALKAPVDYPRSLTERKQALTHVLSVFSQLISLYYFAAIIGSIALLSLLIPSVSSRRKERMTIIFRGDHQKWHKCFGLSEAASSVKEYTHRHPIQSVIVLALFIGILMFLFDIPFNVLSTFGVRQDVNIPFGFGAVFVILLAAGIFSIVLSLRQAAAISRRADDPTNC